MRWLVVILSLTCCSEPRRAPIPPATLRTSGAPASEEPVERSDLWWLRERPCPTGRLRAEALKLADGTRRTRTLYCEDGGRRDGPESTWFENGTPRSIGAFDDDFPTGEWQLNWPNGKPWYRVTLARGRPAKAGAFFDDAGTPLDIDTKLVVVGIRGCDDMFREAVRGWSTATDAEKAKARVVLDRFGFLVQELNRGREFVEEGRCRGFAASPPGPLVIVPDDNTFAILAKRYPANRDPDRCTSSAFDVIGKDADAFELACTACSRYRHRFQTQRCDGPPGTLPKLAGMDRCGNNELAIDDDPAERVVVVNGAPFHYLCRPIAERAHRSGSKEWTYLVPIAAEPGMPAQKTLEAARAALVVPERADTVTRISIHSDPGDGGIPLSLTHLREAGLAGYLSVHASISIAVDDGRPYPLPVDKPKQHPRPGGKP